MSRQLTLSEIEAMEQELRCKIDAFAGHDWGAHDFRPWVLCHALSISSGRSAIDFVKGSGG